MPSSPLYSLDNVYSQETTLQTANSSCVGPTLSEAYYTSEDNDYTTPDISTLPFIPELLLSSLLQAQCNLPQPPIIIQPIHHTLENATITYDTLIDQQKELVKDVFFSPAMSAINNNPLSSSISSTMSLVAQSPLYSPALHALSSFSTTASDDDATTFCGSQTDGESTRSLEDDDFSPSDLLLNHDDSTLFFGALELDLEEELQPTAEQPPQCPASSPETSAATPVLKRKRKGTTTHNSDSWLGGLSPKSTPPMSPNEYDWDYFDASGEDSSSDDDSASSSLDYRTMKTDFQYISVQDDLLDSDDDSISSWENRRATMFDDATTTHLALKSSTKHIKSEKKKHQSKQTVTTIKKQKHPKKVKVAAKLITLPAIENHDHLDKVDPRSTCHPTLYQKLTKANVDWCRYCGTTEGVNWRPGPWGKRTLCNKHGCDYKGYGFACKLPRLDLTGYVHESPHDRDRPVLQLYCACCHRMESWETNVLVRCEGCYKSYHQKCYQGDEQPLSDAFVSGDQPWFCDQDCRDNVVKRRVVVELSRKRLPLMCAPTKNQSQPGLCTNIAMALDTNNNLLHSPFANRPTRGTK